MKTFIKLGALAATAISCFTNVGITTAQAETSRLDQMISPAFHQVNFEDPRAISELRLIYAYHDLSEDFAAPVSFVNIWAAQLRFALTDKLSLIATKDGIVRMSFKGAKNETGFGDISAGLKYTLVENKDCGVIVAGTLRYIAPTGEREVFQGNGDGFIQPGVSAALALSEEITLTSATGLRIAMSDEDSTMWDADMQLDYRIDTSYGSWHPLVGASLVMVADSGTRLPLPSEGQDYFVFGSSKSNGETMAIGAVGARFKPNSTIDLGMSYQFPFDTTNDANSIIDGRWTLDMGVAF
jgi:hypothetical protein